MQIVDEKKIALTPAYQLAALSEQEQELLVETMSSEQATPSLSQAQRMKKLSQIAILRGISPHNYALYRAAVGLFTERRGVTLSEMADRELVDDDAFRLIINAMLIARYGIAAMKLKKEETSHDK